MHARFNEGPARKISTSRARRVSGILGAAALLGGTLTVSVAVAPAASANGPCLTTIMHSPTPVRENPDTNSVVRKYKYRGDRVTGPCGATLDIESGVVFVPVDCTCATDRIGWVRGSYTSG